MRGVLRTRGFLGVRVARTLPVFGVLELDLCEAVRAVPPVPAAAVAVPAAVLVEAPGTTGALWLAAAAMVAARTPSGMARDAGAAGAAGEVGEVELSGVVDVDVDVDVDVVVGVGAAALWVGTFGTVEVRPATATASRIAPAAQAATVRCRLSGGGDCPVSQRGH